MLQKIKTFLMNVYDVFVDIQMKRAERYIKFYSKQY
jgi:hypothetical protein